MTFAQQQVPPMIEMLATAVKAGQMSIEQLSPQTKEAVRSHLAQRGWSGAASVQRLALQYQREDKIRATERAQELIAAGYAPYQPKQSIYTAALRVHLDGCESGEYPTASKTAQAVASDKATKLLAKTGKKCLRQAFNENRQHPGLRRISSLVSNSTMTAAASGTVSSCLGMLADAHKIARLLEEQQRNAKALEARLVLAEAAAARANARLDIKEAGKDWKEAARAIRAVERKITNTALGIRVGKSEGAIRKYLNTLEV
jgi:hypothetical protein